MKFLLPILLYLSVLVASLQAASVDDLTFTLNDAGTEYSVTDCLETASGSLVIPSTYNGLPVTSIGNWAFYSCTDLTSITIPGSVTSIGASAFQSCTSLTSIIIPDSVTSIGAYAFQSCTSLESITIPNSITSMKDSIFRFCSSLTNITIPETLTSIEDSAFSGCSSLTSITIPDSVASIGGWAFFQCDSLTSLTYEGDAPTFGNNQFFGNDTTIYYYNDATGFSTPTFQGRPSQMLIRGNQQFQIIEGDFTWHEAKADAEARGGQLAVLNTQEKIDAANEYLLSLGTWSHTFIGLTDEEVEGSWKWVTGELLTVDNWKSGEPNGGTRENYAEIIISSDSSRLLWNDLYNEGYADQANVYLLETLSSPEPLAPVLSVDTFYESNSGESITIDASPTDGYPTNYTYQWSFKGVNSSNYFIIPSNFGGTASNYQISGNSGNNGTWKVEVTNDTGATTAEFNYRVYADSDSDGLSDGREEFILGTDPNDNDSDDDTLLDGVETNTGAWVSASDTGTDPLSNDSDSDGLADSYETPEFQIIEGNFTWHEAKANAEARGGRLAVLNTSSKINSVENYLINYFGSSSFRVHIGLTDELIEGEYRWISGDLLNDSYWAGEEELPTDSEDYIGWYETGIANQFGWFDQTSSHLGDYLLETGTDPNDSDTDNDGLLDGTESNSGTYVDSSDTGTDPLNNDSDFDGILDGYETATGLWTSNEDTGTDPTKVDSDGDSLSDGAETNSGSFIDSSNTGTNPNSTDSDGDGFTDNYEINTSYDPTSSEDTPDAVLIVKTAIELEFHGASGGTYRIEHSTDLGSWTTVEDNIQGGSALVERLHSVDDYSRRFFRVIRTDQ